jgi:hypothetical protein
VGDIGSQAAGLGQYAQAANILAGHSLIEAASFYMRHHANQVGARIMADAVEDFWQAKSGLCRAHLLG